MASKLSGQPAGDGANAVRGRGQLALLDQPEECGRPVAVGDSATVLLPIEIIQAGVDPVKGGQVGAGQWLGGALILPGDEGSEGPVRGIDAEQAVFLAGE